MHFNWRTALFLLRLLARWNKDLQHCLMYRLWKPSVCWEGGLQKWQAVILNQTWNKLFLGTYFSVDQRYVKYMYLYKYNVTVKFWCYVCCQILCLKNKITFLLPVTCRIINHSVLFVGETTVVHLSLEWRICPRIFFADLMQRWYLAETSLRISFG